jgi:hypothetical protein
MATQINPLPGTFSISIPYQDQRGIKKWKVSFFVLEFIDAEGNKVSKLYCQSNGKEIKLGFKADAICFCIKADAELFNSLKNFARQRGVMSAKSFSISTLFTGFGDNKNYVSINLD